MKFRKKPVVIEAYQFNPGGGNSVANVPAWFVDALLTKKIYVHDDQQHLGINTLEGVMQADVGDWIIRGVKGELYPCKPDIFSETYDREPEVEHG